MAHTLQSFHHYSFRAVSRRWSALQPSICSALMIASLILLAGAQKDPVNDFCRRFGHQTAVIDDRLFIDGGLVNWNPLSSNPTNVSNTWLSYNDLKNVVPGYMPQLYANLSKNGSIPEVSGGILWADTLNRRFYLFGGEYYQTPPDSYNLLSYDAIYNKWDSFGPPMTSVKPTAWGAGIGITERGEGYYYGGWQSNVTTSGWGTDAPAASSTMVKYSMDGNLWTVYSGPDSIPRAEGEMVFIPASDGGMLIYFGGIATPYGNDTMIGMPMSTILIYDITNAKWYNQTATGDIPGMRRRFCAAAAWPADQSSYNIYLYGGLGVPPNGVGYDDVYILSMPSFKWIRYYPDSGPDGAYPHHSMSCNIIGGNMLVIGGTFPTTDQCDIPTQAGTHNLDLGRQNILNQTWYQYLPNITTYVVPPILVSQIGGNVDGGATVLSPSPSAPWGSPDLPVKFPVKATYAARTIQAGRTVSNTTSTSDPHTGLSTGAEAGIGIAAAFAFITGLLLVLYLIRLRYKKRRNAQLVPSFSEPSPYDTNGRYHSPYSTHYPPGALQTNLQPMTTATPVEMAASPKFPSTLISAKQDGSEHSHSALSQDNSPVHQTYYHPTQEGTVRTPSDVHSGGTATWAELSAHRLSRNLGDGTPRSGLRDLDA